MTRRFRSGERILLFDAKGRRYLVTLAAGGEFHTHSGPVDHDQVLGHHEGVVVRSSGGARYTAVRPTLAEVVLKMPRGAQVIYPKDLGPILMMGDIFPGARVLESGLGSGAMSMALLRAGAEVTGYEIRPDFANRAKANVAAFLGPEALERYQVRVQDIYEGVHESGFDRMVLDLPEPWRLVEEAEAVLRPGGILVSYLPTIGQVSTLRGALDKSGFGMAETVEVLQRSWHIEGQSVRPDHRMVAHTGFLTSARLLSESPAPLPNEPDAPWEQEAAGPAEPVPEPGPATTGPDTPGPDATGPDTTGPDATGPDATGPDTTGPDTTGPGTEADGAGRGEV